MVLAKIRRHSGRLLRLVGRGPRDQWLVVKAFVLLGHSRYLIKRRGLKGIEPVLGARLVESPCEISAEHQAYAERVSRAVVGVKNYTPWVSNCFPQALAAQRLLDAEDVDCTVYFGAVLRAPQEALAAGAPEVGAFAAHAWVRCGNHYVTGGDVRHLYEPMVWFSQFE